MPLTEERSADRRAAYRLGRSILGGGERVRKGATPAIMTSKVRWPLGHVWLGEPMDELFIPINGLKHHYN
jgi:hypothetical protein